MPVVRMDANVEKKVSDVLEWVSDELERAFPEPVLQKWARAMTGNVNKTSKKNLKKVASKVDLEIEPMMHDRGIAPWLQNIVDENVGLIKSIPLSHLPTFKNGLIALITADATHTEIRKMIEENFRMTRNKAKLIARDQVGKLNGKINQYRQQQLGGKRYIWRTSEDERVRQRHQDLDGTVHSWEKPPVVDTRTNRRGHPGEDYQCRCRAEMVLEDVLE
jgi:SPP1 gp7 family putative phage head morphogenesis protein